MTPGGVFFLVLAPILLVAAAGYMLARRGLIEDSRPLARVSVYVLLPALTLSVMLKADLTPREWVALVAFAWVMAIVQGAIASVLSRRLAFDRVQEGGLLLAVMTVNAGNYGIPLSQFAFGVETLSRATIYYVAALMVIYVGAPVVTTPTAAGVRIAAGRVARMPILHAAALGVILNVAGVAIPDPVLRPVQLLGAAAVPIMLLLLGIELARSRVARDEQALSLACAMRLVAAPIIAFGLAWLMGLDGLTRKVAILQSSMPTAVGAALMAVEYDARPALVSSAVVVTTLGSLVTLTVLLGVLGH